MWNFFWSLDGRRQSNGFGANPVSHQEIDACSRNHGIRLRPWELRALSAMEGVRLRWLNRDTTQGPEAVEPLTPGVMQEHFG